jgi:hypothetical protein
MASDIVFGKARRDKAPGFCKNTMLDLVAIGIGFEVFWPNNLAQDTCKKEFPRGNFFARRSLWQACGKERVRLGTGIDLSDFLVKSVAKPLAKSQFTT